MNLLERDASFFAQAGTVVFAQEFRFTPGTIEQINSLHADVLGTPFFTRFDASANPYVDPFLVALGLPLTYEENQHLILLISGKKLIVEPIDETSFLKYGSIYSGGRAVDLQQAVDLKQIGTLLLIVERWVARSLSQTRVQKAHDI